MQSSLNARLIAAADRMIEYQDCVFETIQKLESENMSRIVWLVALAGFALINIPTVAGSLILNDSLSAIMLAWIVMAFRGSITHWQFRNKSVKNLQLYTVKRELLMAYVTNGEDVATLADLQAITNNSKPPLPERLKSQIWTVRPGRLVRSRDSDFVSNLHVAGRSCVPDQLVSFHCLLVERGGKGF